MSPSHSSICVGRVSHHRLLPRPHRFDYRVMMFAIALDEVDELARSLSGLRLEGAAGSSVAPVRLAHALPGRFTLRRSDFLPTYPGTLDEAARAMFLDLSGAEAPGRVVMIANLRSLGWNFNPITLFLFYDGPTVVRAVAEVTNTPWNERHLYLLEGPGPSTFAKAHHVSPFLEMDGTYRVTYGVTPERVTLSMVLFDPAPGTVAALGARRFAATMTLERGPLTPAALRRAAWRYPDSAWRVSLRIYLQAARLFAKRVRYVPHPSVTEKGADVVRP